MPFFLQTIKSGLRYGGISNAKDDGTPLSIVKDSSLVIPKVMRIPNTIKAVSRIAANTELNVFSAVPIKNIVSMAMRVGKRPLHGTKLLVSMASKRSRGESIIRAPTMPAALHPHPIDMVSACLPHARQRKNTWSKLYAIRGRYPTSSSNVKRGKNIAIGGNITDTTVAVVWKTPSIKKDTIFLFKFMFKRHSLNRFSTHKNRFDNSLDG